MKRQELGDESWFGINQHDLRKICFRNSTQNMKLSNDSGEKKGSFSKQGGFPRMS